MIRIKSIHLYENKNSFLNGLTPGVKALYILIATLIPPILGYDLAKLGFIALSILLLLSSGVFKKTYSMIFISSFIVISIFIVQGLFGLSNITPAFQIGPLIFYQEGLLTGLDIMLNILNIIFSMSVFILTTKPADIADALVSRGVSPRLGYVFVSLFLLVPQMTSRMAIITDAQKSRGMETDGNLFIRLKAFLPLISPIIMSSFMDIKERTIALEVRGFNSKSKKTFLNKFIPSKANRPVFFILILSMVATIFYRLLYLILI